MSANEQNIQLISSVKGPLFESSITLKCYPLEFIFAEKLETVIHRGAENSRMKDFHDLFTLVHAKNALDRKAAESAICAVFSHRGTPVSLPIQFDGVQTEKLQEYWRLYPTLVEKDRLPEHVSSVIHAINNWWRLGEEREPPTW